MVPSNTSSKAVWQKIQTETLPWLGSWIGRGCGVARRDQAHIRRARAPVPNGSNRPRFEVELWRSQMAAIARILSRASGIRVDVETLKTIAMFGGVALFVFLLFAT